MSERGRKEVTSSPSVGTSPDKADEREGDMDDRAVERRDDAASRGHPPLHYAAGQDAHVTDEVRKRRTLKMRIGTRRTSITTATADP